MLDFLERFSAQAVKFGWTDRDLFNVHEKHGIIRSDKCGALVMGGHLAEEITADRIGFGNLAYHRTQIGNPHSHLRGVSIWAF